MVKHADMETAMKEEIYFYSQFPRNRKQGTPSRSTGKYQGQSGGRGRGGDLSKFLLSVLWEGTGEAE